MPLNSLKSHLNKYKMTVWFYIKGSVLIFSSYYPVSIGWYIKTEKGLKAQWFVHLSKRFMNVHLIFRQDCQGHTNTIMFGSMYAGLSTFENCLAWGTKTWNIYILIFCICVCQIVYRFYLLRKSDKPKKKKKKVMFSMMREILHAWQDGSHSCGRFYMLGVRNSARRETHPQCVRVNSSDVQYLNFNSLWESMSHYYMFLDGCQPVWSIQGGVRPFQATREEKLATPWKVQKRVPPFPPTKKKWQKFHLTHPHPKVCLHPILTP